MSIVGRFQIRLIIKANAAHVTTMAQLIKGSATMHRASIIPE